LGRSIRFSARGLALSRGFSLTELVVTVAVMLVLAAIAIPTLTRAFAVYQLNDNASRLSGILKYTRYEAIRLNKQVPARVLAVGSNWSVFADTNGNGVADPSEAIDMIVLPLTLVPAAGMPDTTPISSSLGNPVLVLNSISAMNATVMFDARGAALGPNNNSTVYVLYLGNTADTDIGYRAVVLMPSGMVQVWSSAGGTWQLVG
jgi:prepilin-type N-terminal cleavage/methylation domain-containing protein